MSQIMSMQTREVCKKISKTGTWIGQAHWLAVIMVKVFYSLNVKSLRGFSFYFLEILGMAECLPCNEGHFSHEG